MAKTYDAVIIGGGHNGLVSAAYLARAGMSTLVLEKRELLGGAAVTEEIFPGFRFSVASYVVSLLRPEIIRELNLPAHGLDILPLDGTFTPLQGDYLWRVNDHGRTIRELRRWSKLDAEAYEEYGQLMVEMARFIKPILSIVPPDPTGFDPRQFAPLAGLARAFQRLPQQQQAVFIQLMTMSASDFLSQWFETDPLKATMSASGIIGTYQGVKSPGTAYVLLHHYMGEIDGAFRAWGIPRGGTGSVSNAIGSAARAQGAEIRLDAPVARIMTRDGRAVGVALESGEEIQASHVLSSVDSRLTYLGLIEPGTLEPEFEEEVRRFKFRGSSGKVNLAVDRLPDFTCLPGEGEHLRGAISYSASIDDMERAYDDAKYGKPAANPMLECTMATALDPSLAPPGQHILSMFVQYAPYHLKGTTWAEAAEPFADRCFDILNEYAPNFKRSVLHRQVIPPPEMERLWGITGGNIMQGSMNLGSMFSLRPLAGYANYRSPVTGLYLCGAAAHPGGGVMGAAGRNAAREMLRDG